MSRGQARDPRLLVGWGTLRDLGVAGAGRAEYEAYKEERGDILWKALENCIPDARERAEFHIVGSPLAHEAFLRRDRGTYGMAWAAGTSAPYAGLLKFTPIPFPFPNLKTPVDGLLRCGDSCFPGIGTPSAAASGVIAANTIVNVDQHIAMLEETAKKDPLYKFLSPGPFQWLYRGIVSGMTPSPELEGWRRVPAVFRFHGVGGEGDGGVALGGSSWAGGLIWSFGRPQRFAGAEGRLAPLAGLSIIPFESGARRPLRAARSVPCPRASSRPRGDRRAWRRSCRAP